MEGTERIVLENLCMLRNGSKVLVEDKITEDIRGIIFPGGHVEEHEPIVDSVIREIRYGKNRDTRIMMMLMTASWMMRTHGVITDELYLKSQSVCRP